MAWSHKLFVQWLLDCKLCGGTNQTQTVGVKSITISCCFSLKLETLEKWSEKVSKLSLAVVFYFHITVINKRNSPITLWFHSFSHSFIKFSLILHVFPKRRSTKCTPHCCDSMFIFCLFVFYLTLCMPKFWIKMLHELIVIKVYVGDDSQLLPHQI